MDGLERTLQWLECRLECFDPMPEVRRGPDCLKAFAELAITVLYLREYRPLLDDKAAVVVEGFLVRAVAFLRRHCERMEYGEAARREPLRGYAYVLPYLTLRGGGDRLERSEELLRWLLGRRQALSVEMVPYRELDRAHFLWKGEVSKQTPSWMRLYASTTLARRSGSIHYNDEDAYSATHTILYMTDFGLHESVLGAGERERLGDVLHGLLADAWRIKNWDLMGEVLICLNCLRVPPTELRREAAVFFTELAREDGTVPPHPPQRSKRRGRRMPAEAGGAGWDAYGRECYHTTLVSVLYVLSTVRRDGVVTGRARNDWEASLHLRRSLRRDDVRACGRAVEWLRSVELTGVEQSTRAMHALGLLLGERRIRFVDLMQGSVRSASIPGVAQMIGLSRKRLLHLMFGVARARTVHSVGYASEDLALLLGALAVSYARGRDLTVSAAIVRAAGRLSLRGAHLDEVCVYLLDQQDEGGAFGLLASAPSEPRDEGMKLRAQLRATVDVLSALEAYVG